MKENCLLPITRFRTEEGEPACATNFDTGEVCPFFAVSKMGVVETCMFAKNGELLHRGGEHGTGFLIPLRDCPVWSSAVEIRQPDLPNT